MASRALTKLIERYVSKQGQCSYASFSGYDADGVPQYGAVTPFDAYVEAVDVERMRGTTGQSAEFQYLLMTTTALKQNDRIWIPGDSTDDENATYAFTSFPVTDPRTGAVLHYEVTTSPSIR